MDDWPPALIGIVVILGLLGVYATVFFETVKRTGSPALAGCLTMAALLAYMGVVLYALRDWWV